MTLFNYLGKLPAEDMTPMDAEAEPTTRTTRLKTSPEKPEGMDIGLSFASAAPAPVAYVPGTPLTLSQIELIKVSVTMESLSRKIKILEEGDQNNDAEARRRRDAEQALSDAEMKFLAEMNLLASAISKRAI
jgi:hypothetical protein